MTATLTRLSLAAALAYAGNVAGLTSAWAQADPAAPSAPAEVQQGPPVGETGNGSLSEQLDESKGVIAPSPSIANTDPSIVKPAPETGSSKMPVIPPPGTPENAPNVQPK
jgi:hypothetical protein